mmetsp:Transcript_20988/g.33513  ORF Transcript_20988/g.33513 Transcript_20988/m.33513 type:complete len:254 (+) Transcript_20988:617-1378(+)
MSNLLRDSVLKNDLKIDAIDFIIACVHIPLSHVFERQLVHFGFLVLWRSTSFWLALFKFLRNLQLFVQETHISDILLRDPVLFVHPSVLRNLPNCTQQHFLCNAQIQISRLSCKQRLGELHCGSCSNTNFWIILAVHSIFAIRWLHRKRSIVVVRHEVTKSSLTIIFLLSFLLILLFIPRVVAVSGCVQIHRFPSFAIRANLDVVAQIVIFFIVVLFVFRPCIVIILVIIVVVVFIVLFFILFVIRFSLSFRL